MRILFIDQDEELIGLFKNIDSMESFTVEITTTLEESQRLYTNESFDIVIINFTILNGREILDYIEKIEPKQRVITLSEELVHSTEGGALNCQMNFNRRRLLKPLKISELIYFIKNFDETPCKYQNKFNTKEGILSIMDDILRRYSGSHYDKKTQTIINENSNHIVDIVNILGNYQIQYELRNNNIKVS